MNTDMHDFLSLSSYYISEVRKESQRDFKRIGNPAVHVTQKKLCARVTHEAFERLKERADKEGKTRSEVLGRMLSKDFLSIAQTQES